MRAKTVQVEASNHFCIMFPNDHSIYLEQCLREVERLVGRGDSNSWTTYDFEIISDAIFERTEVRLSVTTLKRLWGRLRYNSAPTLTTLNAIAKFAGYEDWRMFQQQAKTEDRPKTLPTTAARPAKKLRMFMGIGAVAFVLAVGYLMFLSATNAKRQFDPTAFDFTADKMVSNGVPNSVIFHYSARQEPDSLFIVQTWDDSRKMRVPADKTEHSAIYYYPGFFRTKLIADEQVMKTHDLLIGSDGWLGLIEERPVPIYLPRTEYQKNGVIEANADLVSRYKKADGTARVRFFNQRDLGDLMNDNFVFETMVKNDFDDGSNPCHKMQVLIQCKDDIIIIPLASAACTGDLSLYFCGSEVESKFGDLSGFGCDLRQWTSLRVETINKTATLFVNGRKATALTFPNSPTGIVGVQYRFNGAGSVKETRFVSKGKVYEMH